MNGVIIRPLITEKTMQLVGKHTFTFIVANKASKEEIKKAVEKAFSVHVTGVDTVTVKGKTKRIGKLRSEVVITPTKKAIVTLKAGEKIDIFELGS